MKKQFISFISIFSIFLFSVSGVFAAEKHKVGEGESTVPSFGTCCVCINSKGQKCSVPEGVQCDSNQKIKFDLGKGTTASFEKLYSEFKADKTCKNIEISFGQDYDSTYLTKMPFEITKRLAEAHRGQKINFSTNSGSLLTNIDDVEKHLEELKKTKAADTEFSITGLQNKDYDSVVTYRIEKDGTIKSDFNNCSQVGKTCEAVAPFANTKLDNAKRCKNADGKTVWQRCCSDVSAVTAVGIARDPKGKWIAAESASSKYPKECPAEAKN